MVDGGDGLGTGATERSDSATEDTSSRSALIGVLLMVGVGLANAVDSVIVRLLAGEIHPFEMGFTRALFGLVALMPWILSRPGVLRTAYTWRHGVRAALKLASLIAVFFALAAAPLADVTALGFAAPLFVSLGAWLVLGERPRAVRMLAMGIGFAGVLVVLRPGQGEVSLALGLALLGAGLTAVIQLMLKVMGRRDAADTLVAWNLIVSVPLALIPALVVWDWPSKTAWALLALQGALGALNQTAVTRAFQLADASLVAPMDFLRLPFVAVLAFALFAEVAGLNVWAGAVLIFVATMLIAASGRAAPVAGDPR